MNIETEERRLALLNKRYGKQEKPKSMIWNEQIEGLLNHHSVRNFTTEALPEGTIESMVAAAQSASVSSNLHQWSVVAVTDSHLKAKLAQITRKGEGAEGNYYIEQAPVLLLWVADLSRNNAIAKANGGDAVVHRYLDSFLMSTIDATLAAQNAAVAAESMGLGIVYLGAMRNQAKAIAEVVALPAYSYVTFGMLVGYPDHQHQTLVRPRPVQEVVLHYNTYDADRSMQALQSYEETFHHFRTQSHMKDKRWEDMVIDTADNFNYMSGRQYLRSAVEEQGFELK